jgi:hypothetical protein
MHAHVQHRTPVTGDAPALAEEFRSDPGNWLPGEPRPAGPRRWRFDLHAGPVHHEAIVEVGDPFSFPKACRRLLHFWAPVEGGLVEEHSELFPTFEGHLTLRDEGNDTLILDIAGDYVPPGGIVGAAADLAAGRAVAKATLRWMAAEIATNLPIAGTVESSLELAERIGSTPPS